MINYIVAFVLAFCNVLYLCDHPFIEVMNKKILNVFCFYITCIALAQDLLEVCKWSSELLLPVNITKCRVLYIGNANSQHTYSIDDVDMCKFESHVDLGVHTCRVHSFLV